MAGPVNVALVYLRWNWGSAYEIAERLGIWRARWHGARTFMVAGDAAELRALIIADYIARPPSPEPGQRAVP